MQPSEIITLAGIIFGFIGSGLALFARARQNQIETNVEATKVEATARLDEVKVVLETWKDLSRDKDARITKLETELQSERTAHAQTSRSASRMEGQLAALMNASQVNVSPNLHIEKAVVDQVTVKDGSGQGDK